ncbi:MAG: hypothetical protein IJ651_00210 [Bacteroidales bacterium]|nr:hypothetical protein [Bacteroidales bacterium]
MKKLSKTLAILLVALLPAVASAQHSGFPKRYEIAQVEKNDDMVLSVFNHPENGENQYYLSVGHLGKGNEVIQVVEDPASELFIPLGGNVSEALETLQKIQELYKEPGTTTETTGCFAFLEPNENRETVKMTCRKVLLSRVMEFRLEREGYILATPVSKSDFNQLVSSVKFYRKLHPKE